jgi:hypothetical protein
VGFVRIAEPLRYMRVAVHVAWDFESSRLLNNALILIMAGAGIEPAHPQNGGDLTNDNPKFFVL